MRTRPLIAIVAALAAGAFATRGHAEAGTEAAAASSSAPSASVAPSESASTAPSAPPLRRRREPVEVEIIDISEEPDRDPQAFAAGVQAGGGWITNTGSKGAAVADFAATFDFGLGPAGARVPWSLEPYFAFALTTTAAGLGGSVKPDRFTEIGVRVVYRFERPWLVDWVSLGVGAVWTSRRPTEDERARFNSDACRRDRDAAIAAGFVCNVGNISPGGLVDVGIGIKEFTTRRARWGFGARVPIQLSSSPGAGVIGFFYAQLGTAL